jgi:predicted O-methyltransferase YrrM
MEFGPLANPIVRKLDGDILYIDNVDQHALKAKYADDPNVVVEDIVQVDVVLGEQRLTQCLGSEAPFDYAVASHVIEHVPNMIGWLREISEVLRPDGRLFLAIPDRRYCFDCLRRDSSLAEFIDAFLRGNQRPTPGQVFDFAAHYVGIDATAAWTAPCDAQLLHRPNVAAAWQLAKNTAQHTDYLDVHCWVFTPLSLFQVLIALVDLDLLPYRCTSFQETQPFENEMLLALAKTDIANGNLKAEARRSFLAHRERLDEDNGSVRRMRPPALAPPETEPDRGTALMGIGRRLVHTIAPRRRREARYPRLAAAPRPVPDETVLGRVFPAYRQTFDFPGEFIDAEHQAIAALPAPDGLIRTTIPGFLRPADGLALYELAYFAPGEILEIGSACGLSTSILCRATARAGRGMRVWSIEKEPEFQQATRRAIAALGLDGHYRSVPGDADQVIPQLMARRPRFGLIFVDHDHRYPAVRRVCAALGRLLVPGGLALFHDFNDERNISGAEDYGIYRAVCELLRDPGMSFLGVIGCCGLVYRAMQ